MRTRVVGLSLALLAATGGCTSTLPPTAMAARAPVSPGLASVYLIDNLLGERIGQGENIELDGVVIGSLDRREYTWFQIAPGPHQLVLRDPTGERLVARPFSAEAGRSYYFRFQIEADREPPIAQILRSLSEIGSHPQVYKPDYLAPLTDEVGSVYVGSYRLVGNHRTEATPSS